MTTYRYMRMTTFDLLKAIGEGDVEAQTELDRRRDKKPAGAKAAAVAPISTPQVVLPQVVPPAEPLQAQLADALRARDSESLERMMELLVDLKTAVSSLEAKIERLIKGDETSEF
jgi:hypothetical protein